MKKQTFKKVSILGLVLMAASAVTAAIVPSKSKAEVNNMQNTLVPSTEGDGGTCVNLPGQTCDWTATGISGTTTAGGLGTYTGDVTGSATTV